MNAARWEQLGGCFRELQRLTTAGQPLPPSLQAVAGTLRRGAVFEALERLRATVDEGTTLDDALAADPAVFPDPIPALIAAGLAAGDLPAMLGVVAEHCESEERLRREMRGVLAYPAVTLSICAVIALLAGGGSSRNAEGLWEVGGPTWPMIWLFGRPPWRGWGEWPEPLIKEGIEAGTTGNPWLLGLFALGLGVGSWCLVRWMVRSPAWRARAARLVWRLPGIGPAYRASVSARFLATFSRLLQAQVPVQQAGALLAKLFPFAPVSAAVTELRERVEEGGRTLDGVKPSPLVPASVAWLVAGGENRGDLPAALAQAAALQRDRAARAAKTLRAVWGPLVQLFTGILVFLLIVAVLTPVAAYYFNSIVVLGQVSG